MGAVVPVISAGAGEVTTINHALELGSRYSADKAFAETSAALVIPGGTVVG